MSIDTDVNNYTPGELTAILGLSYPATQESITEKSDSYIEKYKSKKNKSMATFFEEIKKTLLEETNEIGQNETTSTTTFQVPVKKDVLNPLLENVTTRVLNIDSQYRDDTFENSLQQSSSAYDNNEYSSTFFNANLCEPLYNVLSITLDNVILPKSWYAIDSIYNNNFFWITNNNVDFLIIIEPGNYTPPEFVIAMNTALTSANFSNATNTFCSYNSNNSKFTFQFKESKDPNGKEIIFIKEDVNLGVDLNNEESLLIALETYAYFTFFDIGNVKMYNYISMYGDKGLIKLLNLCVLPSSTIDGTLGWIMGFRLPYTFMHETNTGSVPINLNGTTYFLLVLQDYQTNRISNDIVTIVNKLDSHIALPSYINASLLYRCVKIKSNISSSAQVNEKTIDDLLFNNSTLSNFNLQQYIPSAPRILTQTQLYTTNEIIKNNRKKSINYKSSAPTTNDVLALIPVNTQGIRSENVFIQDKIRSNKRIFFGPVNIDRFTIRLINDKGKLVNLNGSDWSFTLKVEVLYQL